MSGVQRILTRFSQWKFAEVILALIACSMYAAVLGLGLAPSVLLVPVSFRDLVSSWLLSGGAISVRGALGFALALAGSVEVRSRRMSAAGHGR